MAKNNDVKVSVIMTHFETNRLKALKQYMARKNMDIEAEMQDHLDSLYQRLVPLSVREFIIYQEEDEAKNGEA